MSDSENFIRVANNINTNNKRLGHFLTMNIHEIISERKIDEAYIKTRKDAVEALARLRGIGKKIETGRDTYDGNLANEYVGDVYDVYNWMDARLGIGGMNDPKLKQVLEPVIELRKVAKELETKPNSGSNARFGNKIVNVLYPLIVYIRDEMEIPEESIKEAPAGMLKQVGRKLGAKALGAVGAKGKAAELTGKAEVGDEANELKTAFRGYLGKTGGNAKQVQGPQLAAFLKSKGYPNMHLKDVQGIMTPKQVDTAIMQAAQDAAKADGDVGTPNAPQKSGAAPAAGAAPAQTDANKDGKDDKTGEPMKAPQQGGTNVAGKPTTPQVDKNKDGKDDATGEPMQPAAAPAAKGATAIPPELQKQLDALTPTEKKVLAGAL